jgi:hypothetical protein
VPRHRIEDAGGNATEERERAIHATQERTHRLAEGEFQIKQPRVAEHRNEGAHSPRHARQSKAKVCPIDLHRFAWMKVEGKKGFGSRSRSERAHAIAQNRDTAGVAEHAESLEDLRRLELGCGLQQRADLAVIRIQERRTSRRRRLRRRRQLGEVPLTGTARQAQAPGNRAQRESFEVVQAHHLGAHAGVVRMGDRHRPFPLKPERGRALLRGSG